MISPLHPSNILNSSNNPNIVTNSARNNFQRLEPSYHEVNLHQNHYLSQIHHPTHHQNFSYKSISIHDFLSTKNILTLLVCLIITSCLLLLKTIHKLKLQYENNEFEFNISLLESSRMWPVYIFAFFCLLFIEWFFFLYIFKCLTHFEERPSYLKEMKIKVEDLLFFNPCYLGCLLKFMNNKILNTNLDIFISMIISTSMAFLFGFSNYIFFYFKHKILNLEFREPKLAKQIKVYHSFFILMNILSFLLITILIPYSEYLHFFILFGYRNLYLLLLQIKYLFNNIISYKQINNSYFIKENTFIVTQYINLIIILIHQILLLIHLIFSTIVFYNKSAMLFYLPNTFLVAKCLNSSIVTVSKIINLYTFLLIVDEKMPLVNLVHENRKKNYLKYECIICTDEMTKGRKLKCGHCFHLICLMKWLEKGTNKCPLCRGEIEIEVTELLIKKEGDFYFDLLNKFKSFVIGIFGIRAINIRIELVSPNEQGEGDIHHNGDMGE